MGPHGSGINEVDFPIHIARHIQRSLQLGEHLVPDSGLSPPLETTVDGCPFAIAFWHVAPRCAGSQHPQNAIQEFPMVLRWSSSVCLSFREQRFNPLPLFIAKVASVAHGNKFNHYFVFCIQTLGNLRDVLRKMSNNHYNSHIPKSPFSMRRKNPIGFHL